MPDGEKGETARSAILPAPRGLPRLEASALLPSARSLWIGAALTVLGIALYAGARSTSVFALEHVDVHGVKGPVAARVRAALGPLRGTSLLKLDSDAVQARLARVPEVASASFDRDFPNTLDVVVRPERPVAVLRRGSASWLVSSHGRVLRSLVPGGRPQLPRIWAKAGAAVTAGDTLAGDAGGSAAAVLAVLDGANFPVAARAVAADGPDLTVVLRNAVELRLGDTGDLRLKLAIARRALPMVETPAIPGADAYLDVSVPTRPVSGVQQPSSRR